MTSSLEGATALAVLPQAATPCLDKLNGRPWHRTLAVRTGTWCTGIRVDTPAAAEAVDDLLAPLRMPEMDARVEPNFSVELGGGSEAKRLRRLCLVYRDSEVVARRREPEQMLLDLVELLDEVPKLGVIERPVVHATGVLTLDAHAILLPGRLHKTLLTRREALAGAGLELLRTRTQMLDVASCSLLVGTEDGRLSEVLEGRGSDRALSGRFPLRAWGLPAVGNQAFALRAPEGVFAAFATVLNRRTVGYGETLRMLSAIVSETSFHGVPEMSSGALLATVTGLAT